MEKNFGFVEFDNVEILHDPTLKVVVPEPLPQSEPEPEPIPQSEPELAQVNPEPEAQAAPKKGK